MFSMFARYGLLRQIRLLLHHSRLFSAIYGGFTVCVIMVLMFAQTFNDKKLLFLLIAHVVRVND